LSFFLTAIYENLSFEHRIYHFSIRSVDVTSRINERLRSINVRETDVVPLHNQTQLSVYLSSAESMRRVSKSLTRCLTHSGSGLNFSRPFAYFPRTRELRIVAQCNRYAMSATSLVNCTASVSCTFRSDLYVLRLFLSSFLPPALGSCAPH